MTFQDQLSSYKKPEYNEALTRRDFIDPMFRGLGWDMDNSLGYAEAYGEVQWLRNPVMPPAISNSDTNC